MKKVPPVTKCAKVVLVLLNIILCLAAVAMIAWGSWMKTDSHIMTFCELGEHHFNVFCNLLIAFGVLMLPMSVCGFLSSSNYCMWWIYIALIALVTIGQAADVAVGYLFNENLNAYITDDLQFAVGSQQYASLTPGGAKINYTDFGTAMNVLQKKFTCCGMLDETDYNSTAIAPVFGSTYPVACCSNTEGSTAAPTLPPGGECQLYAGGATSQTAGGTRGCGEQLFASVKLQLTVGMGILAGNVGLQCLSVVVGSCLHRLLEHQYDY